MEQIKQFEPGFTLGERAETIDKQEDFIASNEELNFILK
jgi:thioredoxin reductase (NADPH)